MRGDRPRSHRPLTDSQRELAANNEGLIGFCLKQIVQRFGRVDFDELRSEGALGLVDAARGFDPTRGVRFSTYACAAILRRMLGCLKARSDHPASQLSCVDPDQVRELGRHDPDPTRKLVDNPVELVEQLLGQLNDRERLILTLHRGLFGEEQLSLRQLLSYVGISAEGCRQSERRAIRKLRRQLRKTHAHCFEGV